MILRWLLIPIASLFFESLYAHPLRLSLCEIEYRSSTKLISINLKLFLTDVNEALVFDPNSKKLAFCQPNESEIADQMLLDYVNKFFYVKANGITIPLKIKQKRLSGDGQNTALWIYFEFSQPLKLELLEVKNAVFSDIFFDQNNIVYIHVNDESRSIMLNKKTSIHHLEF